MPGFYGGYMGNAAGLSPGMPVVSDQAFRTNPQLMAGNPFGSDFVIPGKRPAPRVGPQLTPLPQTNTQIFPRNQPGREGAINVPFRQAFGGFPGEPGNLMGLQLPLGFLNKYVS